MHETPETFTRDVAAFVGLLPDGDGPLPPLPHHKPGIAIVNTAVQQAKEEQKIDICDPEYRPVRTELLRIGSCWQFSPWSCLGLCNQLRIAFGNLKLN